MRIIIRSCTLHRTCSLTWSYRPIHRLIWTLWTRFSSVAVRHRIIVCIQFSKIATCSKNMSPQGVFHIFAFTSPRYSEDSKWANERMCTRTYKNVVRAASLPVCQMYIAFSARQHLVATLNRIAIVAGVGSLALQQYRKFSFFHRRASVSLREFVSVSYFWYVSVSVSVRFLDSPSLGREYRYVLSI